MTPPWESPVHALSASEGGWETIGPSAIAYSESFTTPHEMTRADMDKVITDFTAATKRAAEAGFLLVEVHAAHGYLAHEFLSPASNTRTDEYGGSIQNRSRFPLEIVKAVREAFPKELPVWLRVSAMDWVEGGLTVEDVIEFVKLAKAEGIDLIDVSSGGNDHRQQIPIGAGYQVGFAERIGREAAVLTGAVGMITSPEQADQIVRTGQAQVVLLARELLRNPYWPLQAADALHKPASWPVQYERAAQGKVVRRESLKS